MSGRTAESGQLAHPSYIDRLSTPSFELTGSEKGLWWVFERTINRLVTLGFSTKPF